MQQNDQQTLHNAFLVMDNVKLWEEHRHPPARRPEKIKEYLKLQHARQPVPTVSGAAWVSPLRRLPPKHRRDPANRTPPMRASSPTPMEEEETTS